LGEERKGRHAYGPQEQTAHAQYLPGVEHWVLARALHRQEGLPCEHMLVHDETVHRQTDELHVGCDRSHSLTKPGLREAALVGRVATEEDAHVWIVQEELQVLHQPRNNLEVDVVYVCVVHLGHHEHAVVHEHARAVEAGL